METETAIVGHGDIREHLRLDIRSGNLAHAYLFCGARHLGKFTVAKWFAGEILTQRVGKEEKKQALRLMEKNIHPDLLILDQLWIEGICTDWNVLARSSNVPQEERAKRRVKTNTIGIDDIRELQRRLHETSQTGQTCCLIRSLERLHTEAANALLKILEEPPPHVLFCCTTEAPSALLPTIVSRMRLLHFSPVEHSALRPLLAFFEEEDRLLLQSIAQGCPGFIIRSREDPERLRAYRQTHMDALRFLDSSSLIERLQRCKSILTEGNEALFLQHALLHLARRLRSPKSPEAQGAARTLRRIFTLLSALETNVQKDLLAVLAALQCSSTSLA